MDQSSENIATVFGRMPAAVFALDKAWCFIYANDKAGQVFNIPATNLTGKNIWAEFPQYNNSNFHHACARAMTAQQYVSVETYPNNNNQFSKQDIYPSPEGIIVIFHDQQLEQNQARNTVPGISAEQSLQAEKKLSDKIINSLPGIFYLSDTTPKLLRWNKAMETISGYSAAELGSIVPINLFDPEDHATFRKSVEKAYSEGFADTEARLVSKTGNKIPYYFTGVKIDYDGRPAMLGMGIDISKRKKAEEEIKKSGERFSLVTTATNDMIWDWNLETNEIWWNQNYNALLGYDNEIRFHNISSWASSVHPEDRQRVVDGIYKIIHCGEKFWVDEYRYLKKDGSILHVYDRGYVSTDDSGKPYRMIGSMTDITDLVKKERAVKESEEKYRNLFERANESIVIHDMTGNILDVNIAAESFSGHSKEELIRMQVTDLLFPEDLGHLPIPFERLLSGESTFNRRRIKTKTGVVRIMDVSSKMLPDKTVMAMLRDVTERSEAELALTNSELRFRVLTGYAPVGIFETNAAGETIYVNEKMMEYSGLSFDELLGFGWLKSVHPDDLAELQQKWAASVTKRTESSSEYRLVNKLGNTRWVSGKAVPVYDTNGQHTGYLGTVSDITKEKLALLALKDSEEKYRSLVEQASDAIYIADTNGRIITVNKSACKLAGYTEEELLKMSVYDFLSDRELSENPLHFDELKEGKIVTVERTLSGKDGRHFTLETTAKMLSDRRILVFARDITERIRSEGLLKKSYEDIRQLASHLTAVREEERKRIGREIHDELGQQLTAVKMDVAWIDKKIPDETSLVKTKLKNIISLLDGSNQAVRRILTELSPGIIDNHGLLEALERQNHQFSSTTGIPVEFTTVESSIHLSQEIANCIFRVYQESLTNIMRYAQADKVVSSLRTEDDNIVVTIEDNGKGFDTSAVPNKKSFGILGMKERVLSQNGKFELQSETGNGTKITITVPFKI